MEASRFKDKTCPCGVTFTPNSGRQTYHSTDCPARTTPTRTAAKASRSRSSARGPAAQTIARDLARVRPASNGRPTPDLLGRLLADCDRELGDLDAKAGPLQEALEKIKAERAEVERCRNALASV